jgi:ABC-2 type transport system ATP-binding protein
MLDLVHLAKSYGSRTVLADCTFSVRAGEIVGLLGRNGAGKSTAMKIACGLESADSGQAVVFGRPYESLGNPTRRVGTLLDPTWLDDRLSCADILRVAARACGRRATKSFVDDTLSQVGLTGRSSVRVSQLSLGMRQRLAIGVALAGDPHLLILDEPANGLDADGIIWLRELLTRFCDRGGGVLLSSHLLSEVEQIASRAVVLADGFVVADQPMTSILSSGSAVACRPVQGADSLAAVLSRAGADHYCDDEGIFTIAGLTAADVFRLARDNAVVLELLAPSTASLETVYFDLTRRSSEGSTSSETERQG